MSLRLFFLVGLLGFMSVQAQEFGGHPPSQKWQQIKSGYGKIIFPVGWNKQASHIMGLTGAIMESHDSSIGNRLRPYRIVLQHQTTVSNGYVALAPYRSELMMSPPLNPFLLGSLRWADQLALHEFRHLQQYSNFNRGLAKVFSIALGQQGQALANALTVPDWFFEGDAIYQESLMSNQGRGRLPYFFNGYRSLWESGKNYSWMKLRNGSLKDYVPDHYQLGYLLVLPGVEKYGPAFWNKVSRDAAAMKGIFYPFQQSVKRHSGQAYRHFRKEAMEWSKTALNYTAAPVAKRERVRNEENPVLTGDGSLLYLGSSYSRIPSFYIRKNGKNRRIRTRDRSLDRYFNYANGKIVYASYRPDIRWGWKDYGELQVLDVKSGRQHTVTRKTKYFMPAFSSGADTIVAVHQGADEIHALHLLDKTGQLLTQLPNPDAYVFSHPRIYQGRILAAARNSKGEMAILSMDPVTGKTETIVDWTQHILGYPMQEGNRVYFTMAVNGKDQTMAVDLGTTSKLFFIPKGDHSNTGEYQPTVNKGTLMVTKFTAHGFRITSQDLPAVKWQAITAADLPKMAGWDNRVISSPKNRLTEQEYPVSARPRRYSRASGFFNFHSWTPFYEDPEFSFNVYSQNLLNNYQGNLEFVYNRNEGFRQFGYNALYGGWLPFVRAGGTYTMDRRGRLNNRIIYWNEMELNAGLQLPLNFSKGRSITSLTAGSELVFNKPYFRSPEKQVLGDRSYYYLNHELRFGNQVQQARQNIHPRWAQTVRLQYRHTVSRYDSEQLLAAANFYTPGLGRNHSLVLQLALQNRDSLRGVRFTDNFPLARGYSSESMYRAWKLGASYHFPLVYPDFGVLQVIYLLRLRSALFYDHAAGRDLQLFRNNNWQWFRSTGAEFYFDTKWWNQLPVSLGIRYSRLLDKDQFGGTGVNRWQVILPLNLIPGPLNKKQSLAF